MKDWINKEARLAAYVRYQIAIDELNKKQK